MMLASLKGALNRFQGFGAPFVLALVLSAGAFSVFANPTSEVSPDEIDALAAAGMTGLSLALLKQSQPDMTEESLLWSEWQQHKIRLFQQQGNWAAIITEFESLPQTAPDVYRDWLRTQAIKAYLADAQGEEARDLLLSRIWGQRSSDEDLALWRRLVIYSYLLEGRNADAYTAMLRYQQDYPAADSDDAWLAIKARVLIALERADEAAVLTVSSHTQDGVAVHVLARLKGLAPLEEAMLKDLLLQLNTPSLDQDLRQAIFAAAFDKATTIVSWAERITVLEQLLGVSAIEGARITAVADALWFAYSEYGNEIANRLQLLVGNYEPWFEAVERLQQSSPLQARAMLAWLATRSGQEKTAARAHELFVAALAMHDQAEVVLRQLYLSSSQFTDVSSLPPMVMFRLVDKTLADGELGLASRLMSVLDAPHGFEQVEWQLRRARIQVLAGTVANGADLLRQIVTTNTLTRPQMDRLVEVVFDLQNAGAHDHAYEIVSLMLAQAPDISMHRQLLFWMADSQLAQGHYEDAARLYLRSAMLIGPEANDSWAQTARYQAAKALEQAGLADDAIGVYRGLLALAQSPERRADLQRQIQKLTPRRH